jgi:hypothetical protein
MHHDKLAEMKGRVVLQQEMMSVKTMKVVGGGTEDHGSG